MKYLLLLSLLLLSGCTEQQTQQVIDMVDKELKEHEKTYVSTITPEAINQSEKESFESYLPGERPIIDPNYTPPNPGCTPVVEKANTPVNTLPTPCDFELSKVVWINPDISEWPETAKLNCWLSCNSLMIDSDKSDVWPAMHNDPYNCNANVWIFARLDGVWYAATIDWVRKGQNSKKKSIVHWDHVERHPFTDKKWVPSNGEILGFMVSTPIRDNRRTINEKSNIIFLQWE